MGLDAVELILEIEEEFDVSITEDDTVCFFGTLGNLHDLLLEKCEGVQRADCPAGRAFYLLRRAIMQAWTIDRQLLRPKTPFLPLLGTWGRRHRWMRLQNELGLELPQLENRAGTGVFWGGLTTAIGALIVVWVASGDSFLALAVAVMSLLPGVFIGYIVGVLWIPTVGSSFRTVGQLARLLAVKHDCVFRSAPERAPVDDPIWNRLCAVLVRELGVKRETLWRDTRLVEDLGLC